MALKFMYARFAGRCAKCDASIPRHAPIWHDASAHKAYCGTDACKPAEGEPKSDPVPPTPTPADEGTMCPKVGCMNTSLPDNLYCATHAQDMSEVHTVPAPVTKGVEVHSKVDDALKLADLLLKISQQSINEQAVRDIVQEAIAALPPPGERIVAHTFQVGDAPPVTQKNPHKALPELVRRMSVKQADGRRTPMWLHGPTGTGKTEGVAQLCTILDAAFEYIPVHETTTAHDLFGYLQPDGKIVETPLTRALMTANEGKNSVILIDEVTLAGPAVVALNALLSNGHINLPGRGMVAVPETLWIVVADNTTGQGATAEYNGRVKVDDSFRLRFGFLRWDYDTDMERGALDNHPLVGKYQALRVFLQERKLKMHITLRQMKMAAAWVSVGVSEMDALESTVLYALAPDSAQAVREYYKKL